MTEALYKPLPDRTYPCLSPDVAEREKRDAGPCGWATAFDERSRVVGTSAIHGRVALDGHLDDRRAAYARRSVAGDAAIARAGTGQRH